MFTGKVHRIQNQRVSTYAAKLTSPSGLALSGSDLYVFTSEGLLKIDARKTRPSDRPDVTATRLVEHSRADAIRVTVDTGFSEPAGTTHDYDRVAVALGDTEYSLTVDGKRMNRWKQGDVAFIGRNVRHESTNPGKPVDFMIVAIK
jgi:hypothetical protein